VEGDGALPGNGARAAGPFTDSGALLLSCLIICRFPLPPPGGAERQSAPRRAVAAAADPSAGAEADGGVDQEWDDL